VSRVTAIICTESKEGEISLTLENQEEFPEEGPSEIGLGDRVGPGWEGCSGESKQML
jgi:hypothetical protein